MSRPLIYTAVVLFAGTVLLIGWVGAQSRRPELPPRDPPPLTLSPEEQGLVRAACAKALQEEIGVIFKFRTPVQEGRESTASDQARIQRGLAVAITSYRRCLQLVTEQAAR